MNQTGKRTVQVGLTLGAIVGLVGCHVQGEDVESVDTDALRYNDNGMSMVNGFSMVNGVSMYNGMGNTNGLTMANGLTMSNGLSMSNGLMTTSDGRRTVSYMVRCALPAGESLIKQDQYGVTHTFPGSMGLCPGWKNAGISGDLQCREYVSACMMALINAAGVQVPIVLDAAHSNVGWGYNSAYPYQEGTFFGDLFAAGAHGSPGINAYFCEGPGFQAGVVPGRIGVDQGSTPYKNPWGNGGRCDLNCARGSAPRSSGNPYPSDGYQACNGWNNTVTVYRQSSYTPTFISGYNYQLTNAATSKAVEAATSGSTRAANKAALNAAPAQLFKIVRDGSYWKLALKSDASKCIDSWWGTGVNVGGCSGGNAGQQFAAGADNRGRFTLKNIATGKMLAVNSSGNLEFQASNGSDHQAWKLGAIDIP